MTTSNVVPLNSRLTIKAYVHGNQLAVMLIGGQYLEPLKYIRFQSLVPRASILKESVGERNVHRLIIRNFDLGESVTDIVNVQLPSEEVALSALNSFYESLAHTLSKRSVDSPPAGSYARPRGLKNSVALPAAVAVVASIVVSASFLFIAPPGDKAQSILEQLKPLPNMGTEVIARIDPKLVLEEEMERQAQRLPMEHSNEFLEPRLKPQDLKNMEVVGQVSGFDLWPNQKDGEPLWVFVTPGTKETATLLKRIDNMPKIEGKKIRPIIIPVAMSESGIRSTIQTICVDGKTDPVTTVPNAWRTGLLADGSQSGEECIGGLNRIRLATQTFDYMGFAKAPLLVSASGVITAFANASSQEISNWVERVK